MWIKTTDGVINTRDMLEASLQNDRVVISYICGGNARNLHAGPASVIDENDRVLVIRLTKEWCHLGDQNYVNLERFARIDVDKIKRTASLYFSDRAESFSYDGAYADAIRNYLDDCY